MYTIEYLHPNTDVTLSTSVRAYTIIGPGEAVLKSVSTTHVCKWMTVYSFIKFA